MRGMGGEYIIWAPVARLIIAWQITHSQEQCIVCCKVLFPKKTHISNSTSYITYQNTLFHMHCYASWHVTATHVSYMTVIHHRAYVHYICILIPTSLYVCMSVLVENLRGKKSKVKIPQGAFLRPGLTLFDQTGFDSYSEWWTLHHPF